MSRSGGPRGEAPGVYSVFNAKYGQNLFHFSTFFLQIFTYRKKVRGINTWPPPVKKWKSRGQPPAPHVNLKSGTRRRSPVEATVVYCIFNAKYFLNLFYFNTFLLRILHLYEKSVCVWGCVCGRGLHDPPCQEVGFRGEAPGCSMGFTAFSIQNLLSQFDFLLHSSYK